MHIIYFIDNKLGGVTSLNYNLITNCNIENATQTIIYINCLEWQMSTANLTYPANPHRYFNFSKKENYHTVLKRLHKMIPREPGAIVVNYDNEMAMLDQYPVKQTVYQLVHDEYNIGLAKEYGHVADIFICHNSSIYSQLKEHFTNRQDDIYYLPHGVIVPSNFRIPTQKNAPLQLLFIGRMTQQKGIFELPLISEILREKGIRFEWTCIGNGQELESLKQKWSNGDTVRYCTPSSNAEVMEICAGMDIFVLPTKFEGTPVSLLEAMSVGLVPVISDLPGGIQDIVSEDIGYRVPVGDNRAFAEAIGDLYNDRERLNRLSINCREMIISKYDVKKTAPAYYELFMKYGGLFREKRLEKKKAGARLDQKYIPSYITTFIRTVFHR